MPHEESKYLEESKSKPEQAELSQPTAKFTAKVDLTEAQPEP